MPSPPSPIQGGMCLAECAPSRRDDANVAQRFIAGYGLNRPYGTLILVGITFPAINRWAIIGCPSRARRLHPFWRCASLCRARSLNTSPLTKGGPQGGSRILVACRWHLTLPQPLPGREGVSVVAPASPTDEFQRPPRGADATSQRACAVTIHSSRRSSWIASQLNGPNVCVWPPGQRTKTSSTLVALPKPK